jgi:simple sugar transport system ATP-binding protein
VAIQQMAAIVRALEVSSAKVLILDEPTSSLDAQETAQLFDVMRRLKAEGVGIVFITHFIDQVYEIADRITVLRNGKLVGTYDTPTLPRLELIRKMIGRSLTEFDDMSKIKLEIGKHIRGPVLLEAEGLGRAGAIEPFDLGLHAGEVVGLAGLLGSGRSEVAGLLFGIDKPDSGTVTVGGKEVKDYSPLASIKRGVALCPEDRKAEGIVDDLTVRENIILAIQASRGWFKYLSMQKQTEIADRFIQLLSIVTPSADQLVRNLSGGNQQKVILARWLATNPQVLLLDEPTRGIDVGAKAEIYQLICRLAEEGAAIVLISSELPEILGLCDRILIMHEGRLAGELSPAEATQEKIIHLATGGA